VLAGNRTRDEVNENVDSKPSSVGKRRDDRSPNHVLLILEYSDTLFRVLGSASSSQ
jgi:hypothetical protein